MQIFAKGNGVAIHSTMPELTCSLLKKIVSSQVGRVMKLTTIFLFVACLHVCAKGVSQTVNLSEKDAPLQKVIKAIEAQTDYVFFYKTSWLEQAKRITIKAENIPLQEALDLCFKGQPLTYVISGKNITIEPKVETVEKPTVDISGKIIDKDGNPLVGANIKIKGANKGTTTNADGSFLLKDVDKNSVLEVSYVGFETAIVSLQGRNFLVINLNPRNSVLDETIIIAYGTTTKRFSTGNVSSVKAADIERQPVNNPLLALQGRVPGVTVTQTSGLPGAGIIVRVQGINSLLNGNGPLYVVDGVPISTDVPTPDFNIPSPLPNSGEQFIRQYSMGRSNTLNFLNPSDIESIEILKDADATAIYGSRAANGAVLITTKKGKAGKPSLNVDMQQGFGQVGHFMKLLNTPQYIEMRKEALNNDGLNASNDVAASGQDIYAPDLTIWDSTRQTDWQKELIGGTARYTHVNASISGGSSEIQYIIGGGYHRETTVFPGSFGNRRGSMNLNLNNNNDLKRKFHFQISSNYSVDENKLPRTDLTQIALGLVPNAPVLFNNDGSINWEFDASGNSTFVNPLAKLFYQTYTSKTNNLIANGNFGYNLLPGLKISTGLGFTNLQSQDFQTNSLLAERPENRSQGVRSAFFGDSKLNTWIIEPQLSYKKLFDNGKFDGLIGGSFQHTFKEAGTLFGTGFNNEQVMTNPRAAALLRSAGFLRSTYKYNAVFSRLNYIYNDKYVLNLTGRRDGSTRFGSTDKFHNFWSAGAAWIFSQEKLLSYQTFLSFGKLKGSYGTTGSDQIGDYRFLTLYNILNPQVPYQNTTGLVPGDIPNPYLQWEETKKLNVGIDLGFLQDRIFATANYSRNRSSNQLIDYQLPIITGRGSVLLNFPVTIQNTNWEFSLSTENVKSKAFSWTTNINLTLSRNKLVDFPGLENSPYQGQYIIGQPTSVFQIYHYAGVDPSSGLYAFVDAHGNRTTTPVDADLTKLFTDFPKYYGGFQNTIRFKGFQLDMLFQFVKKSAISPDFGVEFAPGMFSEYVSTGNQPLKVLDRWQKSGDATDIEKFTTSYDVAYDAFYNATVSDKYYVDASYLRLKNLSLSWDLPSTWVQRTALQNCRLFAQAQNLLTITNYKGLDPETPGISTLPPLRVVTFGLQLKL
ncbi:MAG: SusC/RagA family TonB-linked outer membrane protein [Chitinophagaceae bacterium]